MKRHSFIAAVCLAFSLNCWSAEERPVAFQEPTDVLKGLSRDILKDLRAGSNKMREAAGEASKKAAESEGKQATFKIVVGNVDPFQAAEAPDVTRYKIGGRVEMARVSGVNLSVHVLAVLAIDQHPKVEKLKKGDKITITGKIGNAEVLARTNAELHLDVKEVKLP
jgi:tRNA(Ile2) C34 agmatinyltransferase TiaS